MPVLLSLSWEKGQHIAGPALVGSAVLWAFLLCPGVWVQGWGIPCNSPQRSLFLRRQNQTHFCRTITSAPSRCLWPGNLPPYEVFCRLRKRMAGQQVFEASEPLAVMNPDPGKAMTTHEMPLANHMMKQSWRKPKCFTQHKEAQFFILCLRGKGSIADRVSFRILGLWMRAGIWAFGPPPGTGFGPCCWSHPPGPEYWCWGRLLRVSWTTRR